jgi:hypothetical protein
VGSRADTGSLMWDLMAPSYASDTCYPYPILAAEIGSGGQMSLLVTFFNHHTQSKTRQHNVIKAINLHF